MSTSSVSAESKQVANESKPVANESKPVANESKPAANESKPVANESNLDYVTIKITGRKIDLVELMKENPQHEYEVVNGNDEQRKEKVILTWREFMSYALRKFVETDDEDEMRDLSKVIVDTLSMNDVDHFLNETYGVANGPHPGVSYANAKCKQLNEELRKELSEILYGRVRTIFNPNVSTAASVSASNKVVQTTSFASAVRNVSSTPVVRNASSTPVVRNVSSTPVVRNVPSTSQEDKKVVFTAPPKGDTPKGKMIITSANYFYGVKFPPGFKDTYLPGMNETVDADGNVQYVPYGWLNQSDGNGRIAYWPANDVICAVAYPEGVYACMRTKPSARGTVPDWENYLGIDDVREFYESHKRLNINNFKTYDQQYVDSERKRY
jgi:hypothetical protein